jgi:ribonuclease P protein component
MVDAAVFREVLARRPGSKTEHFGLHVERLPPRDPAATSPRGSKPGWQVGVVIPKRLAKRAVTRNAIRRRIYLAADAALARVQTLALVHPGHDLSTPCSVVVRLARGWSPDALRSAFHPSWAQSVRHELDGLFAQAFERVRP